MTTWNKSLNWYFQPKKFEIANDALFYRSIGIRFFKRYLPTSGDVVSHLRGIRRINFTNGGIQSNLIRYEHITRSYELRHIFGGISMLFLSWYSIHFYNKGNWILLLIANIIINAYPIMLQRYNRIRIKSILEKITLYSLKQTTEQ